MGWTDPSVNHEEIERKNDVIAFGPSACSCEERRLERYGLAIKVGSRALDILIALANRAGHVVCNEELTARVWPDAAVEESGLRVHIAGLRKALGDGREGARYVMNVPGRGYCFVAPLSRSNLSVPSLRAPRVMHDRSYDLPSRLARIVGAEGAICDVSEHLSARRFVSVVGPGGMGKTTIAVAVAHALHANFEGDVCFVDLGSMTTLARCPPASPPRSVCHFMTTARLRASSPSSMVAGPSSSSTAAST